MSDIKTLSRFRLNDKQQVRYLQGLLNLYGYNIDVDGSFGKRTADAVKEFQADQKIKVDGSVGKQTWGKLGVIDDSKLFIFGVPFGSIITPEVHLVNGNKNYKMANHYMDTAADVIINGGLFDVGSYRNVQDIVIDGVVDNGGNYSNRGIAFKMNSNFPPIIYQSTTVASRGVRCDFIGGSPCITFNNKNIMDIKGLTRSFVESPLQRTAIGIKDNMFYIILSLVPVSCTYLANTATKLGLTTLINLDGGGSSSIYMKGKPVKKTDGRGIPSAICFNFKA